MGGPQVASERIAADMYQVIACIGREKKRESVLIKSIRPLEIEGMSRHLLYP